MKILFAATPAAGHIATLLALVPTVREQGDEALFATGSHLAGLVEVASATFLPLGGGTNLDFRGIETLFPERAALPPGPQRRRFDFERVFLNTMAGIDRRSEVLALFDRLAKRKRRELADECFA